MDVVTSPFKFKFHLNLGYDLLVKTNLRLISQTFQETNLKFKMANMVAMQSGKSGTIRESNQASGVRSAHYT